MLQYDHYYAIGKTHLICQDYVTQGDSPTPFLVLADGCSSSPDTDVGARILCATVKKIIERYLPLYQENDTAEWSLLPNYQAFGRMVITEARSAAEFLAVPRDALDATVLVAFISNDTVHVYVYGDGCILFKTADGGTGYIDINFTTNMPYYLNYWLDPPRRQSYLERSGSRHTLDVTDSSHDSNSASYPFDQPLSFSFSGERYPCVAIASDGMTSFFDARRNQGLPLQDVAQTLLDFKGVQGEFVKRRIPKAVRRYAEAGITPRDDLAIGVFAWEWEEKAAQEAV